MAKNAVITIYQRKADPDDLKRLLRDLQKNQGEHNSYQGRSESEIAKMILRDALKKEHRRVCGSE